jgi:hypothetical protein
MGGHPVGVTTALVVVDDFDIGGPFLSPDETDAPLIIDLDGVLTTTVASQRFKPVCRWYAQVIEITRSVQHVKFSQRLLFYSAEAFHKLAQTRSRSLASRCPMRRPSLFFGTVVIFSTMRRDRALRSLRSLGAIGTRNNGASAGSAVTTQIVIDSVASKRSSCRTTAGRGLPA